MTSLPSRGATMLAAALLLSALFAQDPQPPRKQPRKPPTTVGPAEDPGTMKHTRPAAHRGISCTKTPILIAVMGPDTAPAATLLESPRLFWYVSEDIAPDCQVKFTLICDPADQKNAKACPAGAPPREIPIANPDGPGIQEFDQCPALQTGIVYRWYISVGRQSEGRSNDDLDGAFLERIAPPAGSPKPWYDRLADAYDRNDDSGELDGLLRQVGFSTRSAKSTAR